MNQLDPSLFADVADAISLPSPAFVEKDYYAVQLFASKYQAVLPTEKELTSFIEQENRRLEVVE